MCKGHERCSCHEGGRYYDPVEKDGELHCPFCDGPVTNYGRNDYMCDDTAGCGYWSLSEYEEVL